MTTADTRSTHTDALAVLGTIIDNTIGRDAIHLAVEPVIAAEDLSPGTPIGLLADNTAVAAPEGGDRHSGMTTNKALGIVDPFLKREVKKGQRFLMLLNPGQIATLRHVWDHPAFPPAPAAGAALGVPTRPAARAASASPAEDAKGWLTNFAERNSVPYDEMIKDTIRWSQYDQEPWWIDANDSYDEFWDKIDALLGTKLERGSIDLSCRGC